MFKSKNKIFCISIQRTGTTSVGKFFEIQGFDVANWYTSNKNSWSYRWMQGDFEGIFNSADFKRNQVFEDDPWWLPDFYKILYHRFPKAKFILFTRNSDSWFNSMLSHSKGKTLGNTKLHCKVYRREEEFYDFMKNESLLDYDEKSIDNLLSLEDQDSHYKKLYHLHNKEIIDFFAKISPTSLFVGTLEDPKKWEKLASFMQIKIPQDFEMHVNKSKS